MTDYRAYVLGKDGHRFLKVSEFLSNHPNVACAKEAARKLVDEHDIELWEDARLVCRFTITAEPAKTLREFTVETISLAPCVIVVEAEKKVA
jgi:hypothetical protein